jgi:hypothetical protein
MKHVELMFLASDAPQLSQQLGLVSFTARTKLPLTQLALTLLVCSTTRHQHFPSPVGRLPSGHSPSSLVLYQDPFRMTAICSVVLPRTDQYGVPTKLNPDRMTGPPFFFTGTEGFANSPNKLQVLFSDDHVYPPHPDTIVRFSNAHAAQQAPSSVFDKIFVGLLAPPKTRPFTL